MKLAFYFVLIFILTACAANKPKQDAPGKKFNLNKVKAVKPYDEPKSKQGNRDSYVVWGKRYYVMPSAKGYYEEGMASWYGSKFHGNKTSNGEIYDMYQLSAAHKSLPLPTYVEVTNLRNQRKIILRVNDRGPFHGDRIIDLSYAAALKLDIVRTGTAKVSVRAITSNAEVKTDKQASQIQAGKNWQDQSHLQGRLFTQVGAFGVLENAKNLRGDLVAKQFKYVVIQTDQEKKLYRLRLGPHRNTQEAEHVLSQLKEQGFTEAKTVVLDRN